MNAKELIDMIAPEHGRTSCSDTDLNNGLYSNTHFTRCLRCTLLQIEKTGKCPESHKLNADFSIDEKIAKQERE